MKVKKNDEVLILSGKDAGKTAKVLAVLPKDNKIVVEGVNVQKKTKKARSAQEVSSIIDKPGPIDASNAMVVCPVCGKATRVAHKEVDGKKVRVCKKCGAVLDAVKVAKETKKTTKTATAKTPAKRKTKKAEEKPAEEN
ncbi:MAG: 50S ribosomal protein L24 [Clostridia bacterium]|nr:50S ribosomal protein L24 [Clostridia bacterium]